MPANVEVAEDKQEDRVVEPPIEHDSGTGDGGQLSLSSSLAALRVGCESLGLSKRGGKQKCLKSMIEHVRAQELIAATATTVKVQQENVRVPVERAKPVLPTAAMIDEHALAHFPYEDWCETCVMHKAWQDAHVAPEHERKQQSVMSFDFGIA